MNKEIEEIINRLRPVDDIFFHKLSERREFCEELLQRFDSSCGSYKKVSRNVESPKGRIYIIGLAKVGVIEIWKGSHIKRMRKNKRIQDESIKMDSKNDRLILG